MRPQKTQNAQKEDFLLKDEGYAIPGAVFEVYKQMRAGFPGGCVPGWLLSMEPNFTTISRLQKCPSAISSIMATTPRSSSRELSGHSSDVLLAFSAYSAV